jgi:hypothetical protein
MENRVSLTIEKNKDKSVLKKKEDPSEIPTFKTKIRNLSEEDKKRIFKEIDAELTAIEKERSEDGLEDRCDQLDQQYAGQMRDIENMQFNLSVKLTAIKVDAIRRALCEAFFEGDHVFSAAPRPDADEKGGREINERQEDFLDYKIDEVIPLEEAFRLVFHHSALKPVSILKLSMKHKRIKRHAEETYEGTEEGLNNFLKAYPEAATEYPEYIAQLKAGTKLNLVIEYFEVVYDDPMPQYVETKNFYVRRNVDGLDGLATTYLTAERKEYTYWELLQEEKEERLFDIDQLTYQDSDSEEKKRIENYANETYELFECVFNTKLKNEDKEEYSRCVFYVSREKKSIHGADYYQYWGVDTYYFPFYSKKTQKGFYQPAIAEDLTDINLALNIFLCTTLEGAYSSNLITPIVNEGSPMAAQFIEKNWVHGMPLIKAKGETPDFLNKYFRPSNSPELMGLMQFLSNHGADATGISESFSTGRADPVDPTAPAAKTQALLALSGINIRDYIKCNAMTFNAVGAALMQMYYQRGQQSVKYRINPDKIASGEGNPFSEISREDMVAKTNFQTLALAYDVDKINAKKDQIALWQIIRGDRAFNRDENAVYNFIKMLLKSWGQRYSNNIKKLLPSDDDFQKQRIMTAMQAVALFVQQTQAQAKMAGIPLQYDPKALMGMMDTMLREMMTAPSKEELQARQEQAKQQGAA